jgi:hypothetical protein
MLDEDDFYNKAKKIRERGEIRFKKGEVREAERDFSVSEKMFLEIEKQGEGRKWAAEKRYLLSMLTVWCSESTREELAAAKLRELAEIE